MPAIILVKLIQGPMQKIFEKFLPFVLAGIALVAFGFGLLLLAYLFLLGAFIGLILFAVSWIRARFFPKPKVLSEKTKSQSGRIIDSDDWKTL